MSEKRQKKKTSNDSGADHANPTIHSEERTIDTNQVSRAILDEINEKERVKKALEAEHKRFNDLLESLPVYLVLLTPDYHVPFANRYFRERFGESHGKRCFEYLFGRTEPCEICETYTVLKTMAPHRWEWTGPDGRDYDIYDFPFTDTDGSTLILEMGIDITERKKFEETLQKTLDRLRNTQAQLIQAEKMSALGRLSAGIAHELNNPLMGILNYNQYVLKKLPPDNDLHNVIKDSVRATKNCIEIVNNLLTFSRSDAFGHKAYKEINFTEMVDRVLSLLSYRIEKEGILVTKDVDDEFSKINGHETELQQVMLNLIGNAIDAVEKSEKKDIRISLRSKNDYALITVEDDGCGISPEDLTKIFDPFFTTKPIGQGTGLGLSVSYGIIKNHKGEISCESKVNQGTRFTISLPANITP